MLDNQVFTLYILFKRTRTVYFILRSCCCCCLIIYSKVWCVHFSLDREFMISPVKGHLYNTNQSTECVIIIRGYY